MAPDEYERGYKAIVSDPQFPGIAKKAECKGFRKATAREVREAADNDQHAQDIYSAYGALWVRA